jgi:hypothetical protein
MNSVISLLTFPLLAVEGASDLLASGMETTQQIGEAWNKQWVGLFHSQLYYGIVNLAGFIAAGALVFFMLQFMRRLVDQEDWTSAMQSLILPLAIAAVLANHGAILGRSTLAIRNVIHTQAHQVLQLEFLEVKLEDALQSTVLGNALAAELRTQVSQCYGLVADKQAACLQQAHEQVQKTIQAQPIQHIQLPGGFGQIQQAIERGLTAANQQPATGVGVLSEGANPLFAGLAGFAGSAFQDLASGLLLGFGWAFTNILELALLLNALIGPIAVAGSLALEYKPFLAWLTGFFSLGLAQVSYNIIVGLAAWVVVNAEVTDTTGFLVILGVLAPALALALAAGGGMTTFNVISSGATGAAAILTGYTPKVSLNENDLAYHK